MQSIPPASPLPRISGAVTIDGFTQAGSTPNSNPTGAIGSTLLIEIDGTNAGTGASASGLVFLAGSSGCISLAEKWCANAAQVLAC